MVKSILPLRLSDATVSKRGKQIVGPVTMEVGGKGLTIVMGPNGSGKTTLLRLMHGLERPREGSVQWSVDIQTARLNQSFVFQAPIMLRRTALENIIYPLLLQGVTKHEAANKARKWISRIGLKHAENLNASFLSGGEKQKLALARALSTNPQVLFLDEPAANLDGRATAEIEDILLDAHQAGTRIIMTTHDIGQGKRLADDVVFLYRGVIHEHGPAASFFKAPKTKEARAFIKGEILK